MTDAALTRNAKDYLSDMSRGGALVSVASTDRFAGAPEGHHPNDFLPEAAAVVVIALPIVSGLMRWNRYLENSRIVGETGTYVDADGREETWSPRTVIRKHVERRCAYEIINNELQTLSMYGAMFLERAGHVSTYLPTTYGQTLSWPSAYKWDFPRPPQEFAPFSHRHAAVAAGLGTFGLNNLLLTPQFGPRQRLVSIITDAPLVADPLPSTPACLGRSCSECVKACPAHALGEVLPPEEGDGRIVSRFQKSACMGFYKGSPFGAQCGRECMSACPAGRKTGP